MRAIRPRKERSRVSDLQQDFGLCPNFYIRQKVFTYRQSFPNPIKKSSKGKWFWLGTMSLVLLFLISIKIKWMFSSKFDNAFVRPEKKNIRDQFALQKKNEKVSPFRMLVNDQWSYKRSWGRALLVGCWLQPLSYSFFSMSLLALLLGRWAFVFFGTLEIKEKSKVRVRTAQLAELSRSDFDPAIFS